MPHKKSLHGGEHRSRTNTTSRGFIRLDWKIQCVKKGVSWDIKSGDRIVLVHGAVEGVHFSNWPLKLIWYVK